ncbi:anaphase-promoting complex subunit 4-like [Styela clava]
MKVGNAFMPLGEKHVKSKVKLLSWSPRLDLLAVATATGELLLYRLVSKERIWILPVPESGTNILSLSWRPDGKVISVAYDCTKDNIKFIYMEKAEILWKFSSPKTELIKWFDMNFPQLKDISHKNRGLNSEEYLPKVPELHIENEEKTGNLMYAVNDENFYVLLSCDSNCNVTILVNGIFPIARVTCHDQSSHPHCILGMQISPNIDSLTVVYSKHISHSTETWATIYNLKVLTENIELYYAAAHKAYKVLTLDQYLNIIFESISEKCDTVTQEVDSQLTSYLVKSSSSENIGDDFLQLLIWGKPTDSLKNILTRHFTKKDIKKLGILIESSYTSIQQQLIVNFQTGLMSLYYHLTELRGMAVDNKNVLPFEISDVEHLLSTTGSLMLKVSEMLQVIDTSLKNFKAFFRWLYCSMLKMQAEPVDDMGQSSGNDVALVADFIYEHLVSRRQTDLKKGKQFHLEKVYQYLKDEPLTQLAKTTQNEWTNFVASSSILSNSKLIIHPQPESSLRQIFNRMTNQLLKLVSLSGESINCNVSHKIQLDKTVGNFRPKVQLWIKESTNAGITMGVDENPEGHGIYLLISNKHSSEKADLFFLGSKQVDLNSMRAMKIHFNKFESLPNVENTETTEQILEIFDFDWYDENTMTFILGEKLLEKRSKTFLVQTVMSDMIVKLNTIGVGPSPLPFQTGSFVDQHFPQCNASEFSNDIRDLGSKVSGMYVASSGGRKVSCVLSQDSHHIYPFLMDHTEEDEDYYEDDGEE